MSTLRDTLSQFPAAGKRAVLYATLAVAALAVTVYGRTCCDRRRERRPGGRRRLAERQASRSTPPPARSTATTPARSPSPPARRPTAATQPCSTTSARGKNGEPWPVTRGQFIAGREKSACTPEPVPDIEALLVGQREGDFQRVLLRDADGGGKDEIAVLVRKPDGWRVDLVASGATDEGYSGP